MNKINPYPITSNIDELKKDNENIIHREHFKKNIEDKNLGVIDLNNKKNSRDKIKCMICDRSYTRSNKTKHCKTKHHIFCLQLNKKWRDSILNRN